MMARVFAWLVVLAASYGAVSFARSYTNPWAPIASPVLSHLPATPPGCREKGCL